MKRPLTAVHYYIEDGDKCVNARSEMTLFPSDLGWVVARFAFCLRRHDFNGGLSPMRNRHFAVSLYVFLLAPLLAAAQNQPIVTRVLGSDRAGLGEEITVEVRPLKPLIDRANCANSEPNCTKQTVALFFNGMPLRGIQPVVDIHKETLRYPLQRTDATKDERLCVPITSLQRATPTKNVAKRSGISDFDPPRSAKRS